MLRTYPICTTHPRNHATLLGVLRKLELELKATTPRPQPRPVPPLAGWPA